MDVKRLRHLGETDGFDAWKTTLGVFEEIETRLQACEGSGNVAGELDGIRRNFESLATELRESERLRDERVTAAVEASTSRMDALQTKFDELADWMRGALAQPAGESAAATGSHRKPKS